MKKKNILTYALIAAGVAAAIIFIRKNKKKSIKKAGVYAGDLIKQTEAEFEADRAIAPPENPSILETAGTLIKTIFPKKTAEQKATKKQQRLFKRQSRKTKAVAGISDSQCLY